MGNPGSVSPMTSPADLLTAYDVQLRTDAETPDAASVTRTARCAW